MSIEGGWTIYDNHRDRKQGRPEQRVTIADGAPSRTIRPFLCRDEWQGDGLPLTVLDAITVAYDNATNGSVDIIPFRNFYAARQGMWMKGSPIATCAEMELRRGDSLVALRTFFDQSLDARRITRPREAFNRWLFESRTQFEVAGDRKLLEPLIPSDPTHRSPSLLRELIKACRERSHGIDEATSCRYAEEIMSALGLKARDTVTALHRGLGLISRPVVVRVDGAVKVTVTCEGVSHDILPGHYKKLQRLFQNASSNRGTPDEFHARIFAMLQRYRNATGTRAGEGSGHHAATPPDVLQALHRFMGVEMECFASPLNCHFPHFCSAFVDTDVFFGSVGSFFDFFPVEGSFESGPPYVEELMEEMRLHIVRLLQNSTRPLSFCIIIPEWRQNPTPVIQNMDTNEGGFVKRMIVVPLAEHVYVDGFQHCLRDSYFKPVHNTLCVVMQNEAGAKKWPCNDEVEKKILGVWADVARDIKDNPLFKRARE